MNLKAVFFDLHGTLVHLRDSLTPEEISEFFFKNGYEIYPQTWSAASHFVGMVDYPRRRYNNRKTFIIQVLRRLNIRIENKTVQQLASMYDQHDTYALFSDAHAAVTKAKQLGMKTAIVTTIAEWVFCSAIERIKGCFDVIMTGYKAGSEKSNPLMYKETLKKLSVIAEEVVMIGDELLVDIKIPKKLGMHTILLDRSGAIKEKPDEADRKVTTLEEAMIIIEKWRET